MKKKFDEALSDIIGFICILLCALCMFMILYLKPISTLIVFGIILSAPTLAWLWMKWSNRE